MLLLCLDSLPPYQPRWFVVIVINSLLTVYVFLCVQITGSTSFHNVQFSIRVWVSIKGWG